MIKSLTKPKLTMKSFKHFYLLLILVLGLSTNTNAQITYTWTGGNGTAWNNTSNWSKSSGNSYPGTSSTDIVIIPAVTNQPTLSTALATSIASLTFSGTAATLTITGQTLSVSGTVRLNSISGSNTACTITGTGTLSCASVGVGLTNTTPSGTRTTRMTSSIATFTVSGTLSLNASRNSGSGTNALSPTFIQTGGVVNVGNISSTLNNVGGSDSVTCAYTMGGTTPVLNFTGATPFTLSTTPTNAFTFNSTGATVNYNRAGNQTIGVSGQSSSLIYTNLIVSGSGTKTLAAASTVGSDLTVKAGVTLANGGFALGNPTSITLENGTASSTISGSGLLTLGGNVSVNNISGTGTGALISCPVALGATRTITVADESTSVADLTISGIISTAFGLTKAGAGVLALTNSNTYTGTTTINEGSILMGASNVFSSSSNLVLNGGVLKSGATTGYSDTMGTLSLSANSTLTFGSSSHTIAFSASSSVVWSGNTLTVNGWTGTAGSSGTAGKIVVGTSSTGLSSAQLNKFRFTGYAPGAVQLSNGEVSPTPAPVISSASTASSTYGAAGSYTVTASNTPTSYNATGLPTGISVNTSTGVITVGATTAAGVYTITVSATNASGTGSMTLSYTVNKAALTVTAANASKCFGTTYSAGTSAFTSIGLQNSETIGSVTLTSTGAASSASAGTYDIIPSMATSGTFTASNYSITYNNGSLTVIPSSVGGVVSGNSSVCYGATSGLLILSGQTGSVVRWESSVSPFTSWTSIANTSTTYTSGALTQTTKFRAVVQSGSCEEATSSDFTVGFSTTTWSSGAWSNGAPNDSMAAIISDAFTSVGDLTACSLTINNAATVVFSTGDSIRLSGALNVANGCNVTFETNANLLQTGNTNLNSGVVTIQRASAAIKRLDYTLWTSPVSNQNLQTFSPQTNSSRFYTYNTNTDLYDQIASPSTTNFDVCKGYLIRVANNHSATQPTSWLGSFTGVPNSGDYSFTLTNGTGGNKYNLIGNPYPSPINVESFINDANNAQTITGTLYFWRKTNGSLQPSYCTYTPLGGFVSNGHAAAQAFAQMQNVVIQGGQGFFVEGTGTGSGTVHFTNSMRSDDHQNHFLKNSNTTSSVEKNRIWLNVTSDNGAFSQAMVGYITSATQGVDEKIDGKYINDGDIALTSLIGTTPYAIQGRALPFADTDVVPLSFKATNGGNYTISLDHVDGLFLGSQGIYLRDNLMGTVHDLNSGAYNFISEAGSFDARFELVYQSTTLGVVPTEFNASHVILYKDLTNNLIINTGAATMASVKVFDLNGKLLVDKKDINSNSTAMNIGIANEVVVVQIISDKGITVTKKFLVQRVSSKEEKFKMVKVQVAEDE